MQAQSTQPRPLTRLLQRTPRNRPRHRKHRRITTLHLKQHNKFNNLLRPRSQPLFPRQQQFSQLRSRRQVLRLQVKPQQKLRTRRPTKHEPTLTTLQPQRCNTYRTFRQRHPSQLWNSQLQNTTLRPRPQPQHVRHRSLQQHRPQLIPNVRQRQNPQLKAMFISSRLPPRPTTQVLHRLRWKIKRPPPQHSNQLFITTFLRLQPLNVLFRQSTQTRKQKFTLPIRPPKRLSTLILQAPRLFSHLRVPLLLRAT